MKKILHLFSDPSHSALWSRYLRMLTLIALFAYGSHGVWGLGIKRNVNMTNISNPAGGIGKFENSVYTWSDGSSNLIQLNDLNNTDLSEYESIVIPVSNWKSGTLRCLIRVNDNGTEKDFTCLWSDTNSESTPLLFKLKFLNASFKDKDKNVITKE